MRKLTGHLVNPVNGPIEIKVNDDPGVGGANHRYELTGFDTNTNPSANDPDGEKDEFTKQVILFQNGPINTHGVNGITHEVLLEIVADRLRSFQSGTYTCRENAIALTHIETALMWLHKRTRDRMARGVEGTLTK